MVRDTDSINMHLQMLTYSFRCAKCHSLVDHDSNLLLLSNGKPICENCSYNCRVCDKKIDDLVRKLINVDQH